MNRRNFMKGAAAAAVVVPVIAEAVQSLPMPVLAEDMHDMPPDFDICRRCGATAEMLEDNLVTAPCGPESIAQVHEALKDRDVQSMRMVDADYADFRPMGVDSVGRLFIR